MLDITQVKGEGSRVVKGRKLPVEMLCWEAKASSFIMVDETTESCNAIFIFVIKNYLAVEYFFK